MTSATVSPQLLAPPKKQSVRRNLRPLLPYFRKYWRGLAFGTVSVLFDNGIGALGPLVLGLAFDSLRQSVTRRRLITYALLYAAIALGRGVFRFLTRWVVIGISRDIEFDLRNDLFRHLETLSWAFYQRTRTGDIMARATNDLNAVRMLLGPATMYSANAIVFGIFALYFMLHISPRLVLYAVLPFPLLSIVVQYFGRRIHDRFERIQAMFSEISARAQENFSGVRVVRAFAQEHAEIEAFEDANREYIRRSLKLASLTAMLWPTLETLVGFAIVLVLWLGGGEVLVGRITFGKWVAFNAYLMQLTFPIIAFGWVLNLFQRGSASMGRINEIFGERPEIADRILPERPPEAIRGEIEFRNLSFAYNGVPVLNDVSLKIPAGSSLAVVGATGSGKSTLVSLVSRIYDAPAGSVLIDGRPITDYPLATLRRAIGFVPQETFLFSDTVRENIALGAESATDDDVRRAAEAANIAGDIADFPEKYQTMVGERGITLSGGQKQRTAIARALIRDPRILVLDDALSSVDTYTEEKILNHLREVMQGRTTLFISHRVSTVRNADRIAVLHGGRIVELGTHDELLARNGYYSDLYNKQLLEEELAEV